MIDFQVKLITRSLYEPLSVVKRKKDREKMTDVIYFMGHGALGYRNGAVALFLGATTSNTPFCHWPAFFSSSQFLLNSLI
jgi:hypothetical protein